MSATLADQRALQMGFAIDRIGPDDVKAIGGLLHSGESRCPPAALQPRDLDGFSDGMQLPVETLRP